MIIRPFPLESIVFCLTPYLPYHSQVTKHGQNPHINSLTQRDLQSHDDNKIRNPPPLIVIQISKRLRDQACACTIDLGLLKLINILLFGRITYVLMVLLARISGPTRHVWEGVNSPMAACVSQTGIPNLLRKPYMTYSLLMANLNIFSLE